MEARVRTTSKDASTELGELRLDQDTGECLMLMRDTDDRRASLKVTMGEQGHEEGRHAVMQERGAKLAMRCVVDEKLTCLPRNYKVGEGAKSGFFRTVEIPKVNVDFAEQMKPYIYELHHDDDEDSDDAEVTLGKRPRKPANKASDHGQKLKRVTLNTGDLH